MSDDAVSQETWRDSYDALNTPTTEKCGFKGPLDSEQICALPKGHEGRHLTQYEIDTPTTEASQVCTCGKHLSEHTGDHVFTPTTEVK